MAFNSTSTITVQNIVDKVKVFAEIESVFNVGGYSTEPALTIATDVMNAICAVNFAHKWNSTMVPMLYTNSYQQDYALITPGGQSVTNIEWLERGAAFNINSSALPKPWCTIECGRTLPQNTGGYGAGWMGNPGFVVCSLSNSSLYYGTWGKVSVGSSTLGNNPVAGSVYTSPLGPISQPANPISQIIDANGNYLVLTTYGTEGTTAPQAPTDSVPGTTCQGMGATTMWTVVDQGGLGIRISSAPSQTGVVWQFDISAQKTPMVYTDMEQKLTPLPDKYEPFFRAGFIAQSYRYSPIAKAREKFTTEWKIWLATLQGLRSAEDRELEEYSFVPQRTVMGSGGARGGWFGPANPFRG